MSLIKLALKIISDPTSSKEAEKIVDPIHVSRPYDNIKLPYPSVVKVKNG